MLELKDVPFKPQAYRNAARGIENLTKDISKIYQKGKLQEIPGIGEHIAKKIEEIILTGELKYYEKLKKELKIDIEALNKIPNLGPKKIKILYNKLKIKNIENLENAIKKKQIQKLPGFGEKTELLFLKGIELFKTKPKRWPYKDAEPIVNQILKHFQNTPFIQKIEVAGSFRRKKATIGDLDFLVVSNQPEKVIKHFISLPNIKEIIVKGKTKTSIRLNNNLQVDLRVVKEEELGAAQLYFIGSKEYNIQLRKIALSKGYTLNEYGLFELKTKKKVAGKTEKEILKKLNVKYTKPEKREQVKN